MPVKDEKRNTDIREAVITFLEADVNDGEVQCFERGNEPQGYFICGIKAKEGQHLHILEVLNYLARVMGNLSRMNIPGYTAFKPDEDEDDGE